MIETTNERPEAIRSLAPEKVTDLDVRPILKTGGEPFSVIMDAVAKTPFDGALKLRATFKPVPLFRVLGGQGWQHWIERGEGDDWTVWFYRSTDGKSAPDIQSADVKLAYLQRERPELQSRLKAEGMEWILDVRQLPPPEPMELTLAVAEKLPKGATLVQINERIPQFLFPVLEERGFRYELIPSENGEIRVKISR